MGFFPESVLTSVLKEPIPDRPVCGKCKLYKTCRSPKMKPSGGGKKQIMIIGEQPGRDEDGEGKQFVGSDGRRLKQSLMKCGINMRNDCILLNALACHPKNNFLKDENAVDHCRPLVLQAIDSYDPVLIILLGRRAVRSVIGHLWKEDPGGIIKWVGWKIPCRNPNIWICPTYHPVFCLKQEKKDHGLTGRFMDEHIADAVKLIPSRPWKEIPDYKSKIEIIHNPEQAAAIIREFQADGGPVAFDYETTCLKPDGPNAKIYCCSFCWRGKRTIAFHWIGAAKKAAIDLIKSDSPKIASNMKFENRWSQANGFKVGNWLWDTMLQSHTIDQRRGITSIKFQAFIRLGQEDYDSHLKPMLQSQIKGGNEVNQVSAIDAHQLLLYCGLDSYLEYEVAKRQMVEMGMSRAL